MNKFKFFDAKEIGTLYLIFAVFAGMIGTAFSVLIRLELSSPGVQFLQGDHQLFMFLFTFIYLRLAFFSVYYLSFYYCNLFTVLHRFNNTLKGKNFKVKNFKNLRQLYLSQFLRFFYYSIFIFVTYYIIVAIVGVVVSMVDSLSILPYVPEDCLLQMSNPDNYGITGNSGTPNTPGATPGGTPGGTPGLPGSHNTTVQIIHDDGNWSNAIRSIFIYGTGGARMGMNLTRGGGPTQRAFIMGSTFIADAASRFMLNALNDPSFVRHHVQNITAV
jgi:hypothetical protein